MKIQNTSLNKLSPSLDPSINNEKTFFFLIKAIKTVKIISPGSI